MQSLAISRDGDGFHVELMPLGFMSSPVLIPLVVMSFMGLLVIAFGILSSSFSVSETVVFASIAFALGFLWCYFSWKGVNQYVQMQVHPERLLIRILSKRATRSWEWDATDLLAVRVFASSEENPLGLRMEWRVGDDIDHVTILEGRDDVQLRRIAQIIRSTMSKPISAD